jgi:hypothetical protein
VPEPTTLPRAPFLVVILLKYEKYKKERNIPNLQNFKEIKFSDKPAHLL